ncbi:hypothetical protein D3C74_442440 [compost metagenome]
MTSGCFELVHFFTDIFKACQGVHHFCTVMLSDNRPHLTRYNRFDYCTVAWQRACLLETTEQIMYHDGT